MSQLGQNIKILREMRKLTKQELALKIQVGTHVVEKYESGEKVPDLLALLRLSNVLEIPASELYTSGTVPYV
ncbi:helix-turn-helix domain-containing protein [Peribacillus kribbensis]|uniref:helix-turn-helix domain-containing protein n=1 Tax=Peribacillus kribbensis TaxID=356658 RepID=UPI00041AD28C|nr:helix-turn-helix transcriptional regulator [Peribacillus kribbensis]